MQGERNDEQHPMDEADPSGAPGEAIEDATAAPGEDAAVDGAPRRRRRRRRRKKAAGAEGEATSAAAAAGAPEGSDASGEASTAHAGSAPSGGDATASKGGGSPVQGGRGPQGGGMRGGSQGAQGGRGPQGGGGGSRGGSPGSQGGRGPQGGSRRGGSQGGGSQHGRGHGRGSHGGRGSDWSGDPGPSERPVQVDSPALQTLAAGLFSHLDDRQIPCKVDGCDRTWTWTAAEQIQAFGQPPPRRMCAEHAAAFGGVADREVPCANPGCERTWTWPKSAQLAQLQRSGTAEPPRKVCPECTKEERELADREVPCRVEGCARTWTWGRDAQLKHRAWARRFAEEEALGVERSDDHGGSRSPERAAGGKRRRRRKQRVDVHEPPPRMCLPCRDKAAAIVEREVPCKVHGCTRTTVLDRESQLRAWARLGTLDLAADAPQARRMCESCREFCRTHPDREVPCGRPGCDKTWTYKTGAQLQDSLAGRRQDPIRLCDECARGGLVGLAVGAPEGSEVMPCVVPLCDGVWFYREGETEVSRLPSEALPLDRMCDRCRGERGAEPRMAAAATAAAGASDELTASEGAAPAARADDAASEAAAILREGASADATPEPEAPVDNGAGAANEPVAANEAIAANEAVAANDPALEAEAPPNDDAPGS